MHKIEEHICEKFYFTYKKTFLLSKIYFNLRRCFITDAFENHRVKDLLVAKRHGSENGTIA